MAVTHDEAVERTDERKSSWVERLYLREIVAGLANTFRHLVFESPFTTQYPEETIPYNPRARGEHILKVDEQGREKCVACLLCEAACPSKCIRIVPGPAPWDDRERYPVEFEIDMLRCIYCGFCEDACPCDAIELTPKPYTVFDRRETALYDKEKLKNNYPQDWRERFSDGYGKQTGPPFRREAGDRSLIR
ncbi:MAG: NADH-quinone oxidoreductase subunit I [Planctomycetota bacterium]|nr:MAG: NADH-quinone oxidoreductase subunit I [Planctomycetota bacterium]